jgi:CRP-like cAMP-binding protein
MKATIQSYVAISDDLYTLFEQIAAKKQATKEDIIFRAGKVNCKLLFLEKGLLRAYRLLNGQDYTHHFFVENWFATDFKSYLTERPSELYIAALTDVVYYELDKTELLQLYRQHPEFEKLGRIIAEQAYLKMVERSIDLQTTNLKERYHKLISTHPQLFQQAPQKYIASYLGVAEQSLSRIKSIS